MLRFRNRAAESDTAVAEHHTDAADPSAAEFERNVEEWLHQHSPDQTAEWREQQDDAAVDYDVARERAAAAFAEHHRAIDQRETALEQSTTGESNSVQFAQLAAQRAAMDHLTERLADHMVANDQQAMQDTRDQANAIAFENRYAGITDPIDYFKDDPSIYRAYYRATIDQSWRKAEDHIATMADAGLDTRHLLTLAKVQQRAALESVMPEVHSTGYIDADDARRAASQIDRQSGEFERVLTGRADYTANLNTGFPDLPVAHHTQVDSKNAGEYLASISKLASDQFRLHWQPALDHLRDQIKELKFMETPITDLSQQPGSQHNAAYREIQDAAAHSMVALQPAVDARKQLTYEAMQAIDALAHPTDHSAVIYATPNAQDKQAQYQSGIAAMHEIGMDDRQIATAMAASAHPNGSVAERSAGFAGWNQDQAARHQAAETTLNEAGFVDYLRDPEAPANVRGLNEATDRALTHNANTQMNESITVLQRAEQVLIDRLEAAVTDLDHVTIERTHEQLAQLNADYAPADAIAERRNDEQELLKETQSYQRQISAMTRIAQEGLTHTAGQEYSYRLYSDNRMGFEHLLASPGVAAVIQEAEQSRYHGHDQDVAALTGAADRWRRELNLP